MKQAAYGLQFVASGVATHLRSDAGARVRSWFEELRAPVYAYAVTLIRRREVAEDLTQETFLRLYTHLAQGNEIDNVKAWAFRVCHNLAVNYVRKNPLNEGVEHRAHNGRHENPDDAPAGVDSDPELRLIEKERNERLEQLIGLLTEHQRRCLYLRAEGFRYREIAEQLDITISSVVDTLTRAVERLRKAHADAI